MGIEQQISGKIQKIGTLTIPAKPLTQLLQSLRDETITLEGKQHHLTIHTPSTTVTLLGLNPGDFPSLPTITPEYAFTIPSTKLISALQRVTPAAATSELKPELAGVFIRAAPGSIVIAATDSFRLAEQTITDGATVRESGECIIPARVARELIRTLPADGDDEIQVSVGEHQVVCAWGETRILSRLIDGAYPPYRNIIPSSYESTLLVNREDLLKKIRLAAVFSSRLNDVTITFSPTEFKVSTANAETGSTTAHLATKGRGASGTVVFNYRYLVDGLEAAGGENVLMSLNGVSGPTLIQNPTDNSFLYLLMPIRSV